jgi:hypothetical protein
MSFSIPGHNVGKKHGIKLQYCRQCHLDQVQGDFAFQYREEFDATLFIQLSYTLGAVATNAD